MIPYDAPAAQRMLTLLRVGVSTRTAYLAAGLTQHQFHQWMTHPAPHFQAFARAVNQSVAEAVAIAERKVWQDKPELWLLKGPGGGANVRMAGWSDKTTLEVVTKPEPSVTLELLDVRTLEIVESALVRALGAGAASASASEHGAEVAGEVLSVRVPVVHVGDAQPEADRRAGESGTRGVPSADGVDAAASREVGNSDD